LNEKKEDSMEARFTPTRERLKLTQENHPENAPEVPIVKDPRVGLAPMIAICSFCGLVGMIFGAGMLSTAFLANGQGEVVCLIPLVVTAVCLLSGWVGAFFWMVRQEAGSKKQGASG
jgi:hypothetical protein